MAMVKVETGSLAELIEIMMIRGNNTSAVRVVFSEFIFFVCCIYCVCSIYS